MRIRAHAGETRRRRPAAALRHPAWPELGALLLAVVVAAACGVASPNYLRSFEAVNDDGTVNAIIEIPAGTSAKFEVTPDGGDIVQDMIEDEPRFVEYIAYPWNYGMVPRTLEDPDLGGDGDPLDIIVLGDAIARGEVIAVRLLGVVRMVDTGDRDDKLVAVVPGSPLAAASDIGELERLFPGTTDILRTWLQNYKGAGRVRIEGIEGVAAATRLLENAAAAFSRPHGQEDP